MGSRRAHQRLRIDRLRALPNLEMQQWLSYASAVPDAGDHLTAAHDIAFFYQKTVSMRVSSDETIGVSDQQKISQRLDPVAIIRDLAILGCANRRAARRGDVHAIVVNAA